jgi:hypothetical protein
LGDLCGKFCFGFYRIKQWKPGNLGDSYKRGRGKKNR